MNWCKQLLIAFDQLLNAFFGGWADETLSSRCWRWEKNGKRGWPRKLVDRLLFLDRNHCEESYKSELLRLQCPPELRKF